MKLSPSAEEAVTDRAIVTGRNREDTISDLVLLGDLYNRRIVASMGSAQSFGEYVGLAFALHRLFVEGKGDTAEADALRARMDVPEEQLTHEQRIIGSALTAALNQARQESQTRDRLRRYGFLAGNPCRTDEEEAEMLRLRDTLKDHGVDPGWEPVPRQQIWTRPEVLVAGDELDAVPAEVTKRADTLGGRACLAGTRMPVSTVVSWHEQGGCVSVREQYPHLTEEQIHVALAYAEAYPEEIAAELRHWPMHVEPRAKKGTKKR